ncbi:Enhancer of polycomb-like transcription factor protein [Rhynchospora pubera]|uniref:Enhancer of polycomb-like protein n=1 Tax=Rhynchospora pubera TaxID=906938 RepID=A0AAV8HSV9_9POAL|nr:Enhancer of polycomb-like transcription factor protein [Rhynchospora pubera]
MDDSVERSVSSEIVARKSRSIASINQKELSSHSTSVVGVRNDQGLHVECDNSVSSKGKGALKEVPLSAFGAGIKRRRNGSKALRVKPNVPGSNPHKEGSRGHNHLTCTDNSEIDAVLKVDKCCLGNGAENWTPENGEERGLLEADSDSTSGATSSLLSGQKRKKRLKYSDEEEAEDLEENAAWMLCSLSDNRLGVNVSKPVNGVPVSSAMQDKNGPVGLSRVLGPKRHKAFGRKRRCFIEVKMRDFNPFSIVKWRIMVYWPLDRSWYSGSVKEYDPVVRMHRVRYDDQEEEWLDLHNERFKLLLFPSDVLKKSKWNENKNPNVLSVDDLEEVREQDLDASIDGFVETTPVKSLLACSSYQHKLNQLLEATSGSNFEMEANKNLVKNGRFTVVYSRKRLRNRKGNLNSISVLASVADTTLADATRIFPSHCDISLKLNLPLNMFAGWVLTGLHFWQWPSLFLFYHGTLITTSPVVQLEIIISDSLFGSKYILFEVCLWSAVSLLCVLVGMLMKGNECNVKESKMPVTSIRYTITGLHGYKGQVVIGLFNYFCFSDLRWAYLQKRINCEYSCIKMEDSSSGLVDLLLVHQPTFSGVNPMIFFMNEKSTSKLPSFLLGSHHDTMPVSNSPQNPRPTTSVFVSGDNNKDGSATNSNNIDDKDAASPSSLTTSLFDVPVRQISHVVALPAPREMHAFIHSSAPTARRSTLHRARPSSLSKLWPLSDLIVSKIPHSGTLSQAWSFEPGSKSQSNHQNIQQSSRNAGPMWCHANVLVKTNNRGWRESGANVVLDYDEKEGARLSVQFSGETKFFYRANQVMHPGSTNRYTHAMMWRGGRDWSLEFTDRNQWFICKQMYEECLNQNRRAASVKNIPTPGVRLVKGENTVGFRPPFARGTRYIRHVESDVDAALDPSRVMYDMDSEDEEWVSGLNGEMELTEDLFEKVIDKCEKLAYMNECSQFTAEQIEELMGDVGPFEVVKKVATYWSVKRKNKGMPLIRHLQPPLWMHYQKLLDEWESSARKILRAPHNALLSKEPLAEKPTLFAFCLKPRGLQLKRPQRRLFGSSRSHGGSQKSGRRMHAPVSQVRVASVSRLNQLNRTRAPAYYFLDNYQAVPSPPHDQTVSMDKRAHTASSDIPERTNPILSPSDSHSFLKEDGEGLKLRDAQNAAQHAANMARLKREKAQLLMQKADLAMYKARYALMIAEAKQSSKG